jgi:hypothetical protein
MCAVCTEWTKGLLTKDEAIRALAELVNTGSDIDIFHVADILELLEED